MVAARKVKVETWVCRTCREPKYERDFQRNPQTSNGLSTQCRDCTRLYRQARSRHTGVQPSPPGYRYGTIYERDGKQIMILALAPAPYSKCVRVLPARDGKPIPDSKQRTMSQAELRTWTLVP